MSSARRFDVLLVGGGLANALIAYRLRQLRPDLDVLVLEAGDSFGGNHTWSFHATDLTTKERNWTAPFVAHRWPSYDVNFPGLQREVELAYCSANSERLHGAMMQAGVPVRFGIRVARLSPTEVILADGAVLQAKAVIDGRGPGPTTHMRFGWQKFVGQEIRTTRPHGVGRPVLMDATVAQHDGYRFVYVLPFAPDRLLVEDTYYSDGPDIDRETLVGRIADYARAKGWPVGEVVREERGVLPITLAGDVRAFWRAKDGQPSAGLRAGLFHPTTGFSWPDAVRFAGFVAGQPDLSAGPLFAATRRYAEAAWRRRGFFRGLDRMLFLAGAPDQRWRMMQLFYRRDEGTVARFYAGQLRIGDQIRLLVGKPPVSIPRAIAALRNTALPAPAGG